MKDRMSRQLPVRPAFVIALQAVAAFGVTSLFQRGAPPSAPGGFVPIDGADASGIRLLPRWDLGAEATHIGSAGDGTGRLFVVEKVGRVRVIRDGKVQVRPFIDIREHVRVDNAERGLFSVAFPPDYADSGAFYAYYTATGEGDVVIARYTGMPGADHADPDSVEELLRIPQPWPNHNGGQLQFGPDGHLYAGIGDGGAGGDPHDVAEDPGSLLGKLLRLDVSGPAPAAPAYNPWVDREGAAPLVWAVGLRNPWRFSFDRATGDLWIADVGQVRWEEFDFVPAGSGAGANFGWNTLEGAHCHEPREGCETVGRWMPIHEYSHEHGCSVTGGYVYRGDEVASLAGTYLFADFCAGTIWGLRRTGETVGVESLATDTGLRISSFGEGDDGALYVVDLRGWVFEVVGR